MFLQNMGTYEATYFPQDCNLNANEVHKINYVWKEENKYESRKEKVHRVMTIKWILDR